MSDHQHWENAYERGELAVSWHQAEATNSLALIESIAPSHKESLVDIGGGASTLVDGLLDVGFSDLTVLDLSETALSAARARLGERGQPVNWIAADLMDWQPAREYSIWHDRAVLHFLTDPKQTHTYHQVMRSALTPGGHAVIGVFSEDGPEQCSGLNVQRYSFAALREFLGSSFQVLSTTTETHTTPAGKPQHFNWMVARRDR